jgi:hypothetical protein
MILGQDRPDLRSNVSGSWGTSTSGLVWAHPVGGSTLNVTSGALIVVNTPGTWDHMLLGSVTSGPQEVYAEVVPDATTENFGALLRYTSAGSAGYMMIFDGGSHGAYIYKEDPVNGLTTLKSVAMAITANTLYCVRARADGSTLMLKVWQRANGEPAQWSVVTSDTTYTSGQFGLLGKASNNLAFKTFLAVDYPLSEVNTVVEVITAQSSQLPVIVTETNSVVEQQVNTVSVKIVETNVVTELSGAYAQKPAFQIRPRSGLTVLYAGQDISEHVRDDSVQIKSVLGQGPGMPGGGSSHTATGQLLVDFGSVGNAMGAGTLPNKPAVVRMGEIQIWSPEAIPLFGGFVSKIEDATDRTTPYTQLDLYDYWSHLDRVMIQQRIYSGKSDVFIVNDLIQSFATWLDTSALPSTGSYTFSNKTYKAISLQKALSQISDVTGYTIWIDPNKVVHYDPPSLAPPAPFSLSTEPNFRTSFNCGVDTYTIDDTAAINRVTFYGGKLPSPDFTQDLSTQANGNNKIFVLAYYPREASDGAVHVYVNGVAQVVGYATGSSGTTTNTLKSQGGTADCLLNADAHTITFDVAPTNNGPNSVTCVYRYEFPMTVQLTDQKSFNFFGAWYDGMISDDTVFDYQTAVARCKTLLSEQSMGLTQLAIRTWKAGIQPGQILRIDHGPRNIHQSFLVQEVDVNPVGAGSYEYLITLGNWSYSLIDALVRTADAAERVNAVNASPDLTTSDNTDQQANLVWIEQMIDGVSIAESYSVKTSPNTYHYARSSPQNDGYDAYPGFSTSTPQS